MNKVLNEIDTCVINELQRANAKHPMFCSDIEGQAVIEAEIASVNYANEKLCKAFQELKTYVFEGYGAEDTDRKLQAVRKYAAEVACEAVQATAMCEKFANSVAYRKTESEERVDLLDKILQALEGEKE